MENENPFRETGGGFFNKILIFTPERGQITWTRHLSLC